MLLIIEALLLIAAALLQDHSAAAQTFPLGMEMNSMDDQYSGCKSKVSELVDTRYLQKDLTNTPNFKQYWQSNANMVLHPIAPLSRNHLIALRVYTGPYIYRIFNEDTRNGKSQYRHKTYKWTALHFLVTEAVKRLHTMQNQCYHTYRGTRADFDKHVLNKEIRFGAFTSSSIIPAVSYNFGTKSCFEILTCYSAEITMYSSFPSIREVLIPPYETFRVTAVRTRQFYPHLPCDTVYTLQSSGRKSNMNCALLNRRKKL